MDISEVVDNFKTTPFLFVGSGFSKRYYSLPSWRELLEYFARRVSNDEFSLSKYISKAKRSTNSSADNEIFPIVAELIMSDFDDKWFSDPKFRTLDERHKRFIENNISPFKVEIAKYIKESSIENEDMRDEIEFLNELTKKNISGIITTNYDDFLESIAPEYIVYSDQQQLMCSVLQELGEIYKIHGSISEPETIVITQKDFATFDKHYKYLIAKLMTIFVEYPIIFIGYSISDPNITSILSEIANCIPDDKIEQFKNQMLYVDWSDDYKTEVVESYTRSFSGKNINMLRLKTNNFYNLYTALSKKHSTIPISVFRMFKKEFYKFTLTHEPTQHIRISWPEDESINPKDLMMAIGKPSELSAFGLKGLDAEHWFRHIIKHDLVYSADEILEYAYPYLKMRQGKNLPLNMLLLEAKRHYPEIEIKACSSFEKTLSQTIIRYKHKMKLHGSSVTSIVNHYKTEIKFKLSKQLEELTYLDEDKIDIRELECFLNECLDKKSFYSNLTEGERAHFHRLVLIYDYMKYYNLRLIKKESNLQE